MIFVFDLFHLMCYSIGTNFRAYMFSEFSWTNIFDNSPARLSNSALSWCLALALATHHDQSTLPGPFQKHSHSSITTSESPHLTCELFPDVASWLHLYSSLQELECIHFLCILDYLNAYLIVFLPPSPLFRLYNGKEYNSPWFCKFYKLKELIEQCRAIILPMLGWDISRVGSEIFWSG